MMQTRKRDSNAGINIPNKAHQSPSSSSKERVCPQWREVARMTTLHSSDKSPFIMQGAAKGKTKKHISEAPQPPVCVCVYEYHLHTIIITKQNQLHKGKCP